MTSKILKNANLLKAALNSGKKTNPIYCLVFPPYYYIQQRLPYVWRRSIWLKSKVGDKNRQNQNIQTENPRQVFVLIHPHPYRQRRRWVAVKVIGQILKLFFLRPTMIEP